jgi:hypothetical protein
VRFANSALPVFCWPRPENSYIGKRPHRVFDGSFRVLTTFAW